MSNLDLPDHPITVSEKRLYGRVRHNLYEVDVERETAFCTACGHTEIHVEKTPKLEKPKIFCIKRYRELMKDAKEKRLSSPSRSNRHLLSEIDPETKTAICAVCGKTDVWKLNRGSAYYVCGTYYRTSERKYRRTHYSSKTSKPKAHSLTQINEETKTAVCSQCGPVTIYMWQGKKKICRRCANAPVARIPGAMEIRRKINADIIDAYKAQNGCTRCGFSSSSQRLIIYKKTGRKSPVKIERLLTLNIIQLTKELENCEVLCITCR